MADRSGQAHAIDFIGSGARFGTYFSTRCRENQIAARSSDGAASESE